MIDKPLVSVIVPVFNTEQYLSRCIDSLINQRYENIEIVLVDDGSTDNSGAICEQYSFDKRIKIIHKKNGGLSDARNAGLALANGTFVSFVDSDDYIDLDFFSNFAMQTIVHDADVVVCSFNKIQNGICQKHIRKGIATHKIYNQKEFIELSIKNKCLEAASCFYIYKTSFIFNNNLFFKKGIKHEDMQFLMRFVLKANSFVYLDSNFYYYDTREGSIMTTFDLTKYSDAISIYKEWEELFRTIDDKVLKKYLEGFLCRCLIRTIRDYRKKDGEFSYWFLFKKSLTFTDKLKTIYIMFMRKEQ